MRGLTVREKTLVFHQGALGDVVLSFPAIQRLKEERGMAVTLLCQDEIGRMACALNIVEDHLPIEGARFAALYSPELSHDLKALLRLYETLVLVGFPSDVEAGLRQNFRGKTFGITARPPAEEETHVAVHVIEQMEAKGLLTPRSGSLGGEGIGPLAFPRGNTGEKRRSRDVLLIHPGAGSRRKRWPLERFLSVAAAISQTGSTQVALVIGPAERDLLSMIRKEAGDRISVHEVERLSQVMALMGCSKCFLGNDSGLSHMAACMGIPTVTVFGPSSAKRWSPLGPSTKVLQGDVDCVPCFERQEANCEEPQCFSRVTAEAVLQAIRQMDRAQSTG
jgi:ADP-heptose:LPS heptosyltransferase